MIKPAEDIFLELKKVISKEKKIVEEIDSFFRQFEGKGNEVSIKSQVEYLEFYLKQENNRISEILDKINLQKKLPQKEAEKKGKQMVEEKPAEKIHKIGFFEKMREEKELSKLGITDLEKSVLKRISSSNIKTSKAQAKLQKGPNVYAGIASRMFPEVSRSIVYHKTFNSMVQNLLKTNLRYIPTVYVSMILLSTLIAIGAAFAIFLFVLFFNIGPSPPFISLAGNFMSRFVETFWILFILPIGVFSVMYSYPSMERKSLESGIDQELPFATINMSAIAGSNIEPTNIFAIIVSTGEYPKLKTQFTKVINEINIYGHDLITALRSAAASCPSKKLTDLYNGLATNITSGGNLAEFFDKRSQNLLLDYRLERERSTKSAETFIDIYISIVIAAPMILMLLLVMIQISGLGISLSPMMISLAMIMGVSVINFVFLMFLRLRQPSQ